MSLWWISIHILTFRTAYFERCFRWFFEETFRFDRWESFIQFFSCFFLQFASIFGTKTSEVFYVEEELILRMFFVQNHAKRFCEGFMTTSTIRDQYFECKCNNQLEMNISKHVNLVNREIGSEFSGMNDWSQIKTHWFSSYKNVFIFCLYFQILHKISGQSGLLNNAIA